MDETQIRAIIREELAANVKNTVEAAVTDAMGDFTRNFYADVGKGIIHKGLLVLGAIVIWAAWKLGIITIFQQK